jgi:XTP/dITP diphosphohydrolase
MILYAATSNPGKLAEFTPPPPSPPASRSLRCPASPPCPSPARTPPPSAATPSSRRSPTPASRPGLLVMADDSGLEVEALGGQPGVRSARFADDMGFEPHSALSKDARNNRCILSLLAALPNPTRAARFTCELAVARDGRILYNARGKVDGVLLTAPRGSDGFGYDPLFLVPALGLTFAEIPRDQKWQLSHRGNAFRALLTQLQGAGLQP